MPLKNKKRWLWLLLIPGIPVAVFLLMGLPIVLIAGSNLIGAFVGPVNYFNSATHVPADADVQGSYRFSVKDSRNTENPDFKIPADSGFTLGPNHQLEVHDLPKYDPFGKPAGCAYNGTGKWTIDGSSDSIMLSMDITTVVPAEPNHLPSCPPEYFGDFAVLGHARPYRFWYYIDDPDIGEGLEYRLH